MKTFAPLASLAPRAGLFAILAFAAACRQPQPEPLDAKPLADQTSAASHASSAAPPGMAMPIGHPPTGGGSATPSGMGAGSSGAGGPDELAWDAPAAWVSAPNPSPMRKATYKIPKVAPEPDDAELAVSAAAGGVDANVKRWEQQFGDAKAKIEPRTVNGLKVTMVEIKGKVPAGGMMGMPSAAAKDNQMLLGAVIDAGDRQHFFKMVGGEKTVTAAKKDFDTFVSSLHAKK